MDNSREQEHCAGCAKQNSGKTACEICSGGFTKSSLASILCSSGEGCDTGVVFGLLAMATGCSEALANVWHVWIFLLG